MNRQCTSGLQSDVTVEIGEMSFHLHKVTLILNFLLKKIMKRGVISRDGGSIDVLVLDNEVLYFLNICSFLCSREVDCLRSLFQR